ncbi:MAG TPA: hypothetical protein VM282_11675 [Acidimicrobiales bacterium]|nr:hypothetical protein [Acidimicrobiales bacterium]
MAKSLEEVRKKLLEDQVKEVRTGGLLGHGANGHKRARNDYLEMKKGK